MEDEPEPISTFVTHDLYNHGILQVVRKQSRDHKSIMDAVHRIAALENTLRSQLDRLDIIEGRN